MIAFLLLAAAAPPPIPGPFRASFAASRDVDVPAMRAGGWRFCTSGRSRDPAERCMGFQDAAIFHVIAITARAAGARADPDFDRFALAQCRRIYEENGSADARILDVCLARGDMASPGALLR